ncbi:MAG: YraN family protein [Syntrophales bacterium]|nr:YraN family protein [Syntrophales bacterium]MCK9528880.1 YraN family protein [Syntrophales bacterium]MDX9922956.1 YraN family protein [Syntrophales bacterium]
MGEQIALEFLVRRGYRIVERNYHCIFGEIDIIARDGSELVFVEVKSRRSDIFGLPELSVDLKKQRTLSRVAVNYLQQKGLLEKEARFDVLAIQTTARGNHVHYIPNAFDMIL